MDNNNNNSNNNTNQGQPGRTNLPYPDEEGPYDENIVLGAYSQNELQQPQQAPPQPPQPAQSPQPYRNYSGASTVFNQVPYPTDDSGPSQSLRTDTSYNPSTSYTAGSPNLLHPQPVSDPFSDADSRRNSYLEVQDSYQMRPINSNNSVLENPYNADYDYESSDNIPLRGETLHTGVPNLGRQGTLHNLRSTIGNIGRNNYAPPIDGMDDVQVEYSPAFENLRSRSDYPGYAGDALVTTIVNPEDINADNANNYTKLEHQVKDGIFSVEYPVPSPIVDAVDKEYLDMESATGEFTHMRYTACTCDPDQFVDQNYTLRAREYNRETELLIAITYYSEDKVLTARTLEGVMKNISSFCSGKSEFWNSKLNGNGNGPPQAWKKIVVTVIMDGIKPCDKEVLDVLQTMGLYQEVRKTAVNDKPTVAHIFEYTTQVCFRPTLEVVKPAKDSKHGDKRTITPIQYIICLKQENSKKINSHRWLFNAFGRVLNPNICVLIDAGTKPDPKSIVHLWRAFHNNDNLGGACGEIHAMLGKGKTKLLNPLIAAQNFEYKISNILDKPLEDSFGFISVLPGAFSAYRYKALQGRPLEQYFRGDHSLADSLGPKGLHGMNIFKRNMFLAEDRILCFEITFKKNEKWHLRYVKASKAETDVPEAIDEFISQRRRWLNGSFAATLYSMMHFGQIYHTSHNWIRRFFFHIQLIYNFIQIIMTWFSLAAYYLTTTIILELAANPQAQQEAKEAAENDTGGAKFARALAWGVELLARQDAAADQNKTKSFPFTNERVSLSIALFIRFFYLLMLVISFLLALGNRPKGAKKQYTFLFVIFGIIQIYALAVALFLSVKAFSGSDGETEFFTKTKLLVLVALVSTYGVYLISGLIYLDPWHLLHSFLQYTFIMPSFTNVVNVYAFCNWHDVSWGTKGSDTVDDTPKVTTEKKDGGETEYFVEYQKSQDEIDELFAQVYNRAVKPMPKPDKHAKKKVDPDDENRTFRTNLIIFWILCNAILAVGLTSKSAVSIGFSGTTDRSTVYFLILILITAVISGIRLIGCIMFVIKNAYSRGFDNR